MWDAARIWKALDGTWAAIERLFKSTSHPSHNPTETIEHRLQPERIDPMFIPDLSPESSVRVRKHLVWMKDEIHNIAGAGEIDKAQRWLGFLQGAAWAMGMAPLEAFKEANREPPVLTEYKVDDLVQCLGEAQEIFRVAKVSGGYMESTGSGYLVKLDGTDHGWEDFKKLRHVVGKRAELWSLKKRALELRQMADRRWATGKRKYASELHDEAAKLEQQAAELEQSLNG